MAKTMLVVGAGEGIGLAVARRFQAAGFLIALSARNLARIEADARELGGHAYAADAGDFDAVRGVVAQAERDLGGLDVLVYNVAVPNWKPASEVSTEELLHDFRANVGGAHAAILAALPSLKARGGSVLLTGGGLALYPGAQAGSLAVGKAGLRSLARSLHAELGAQGVHVGTVTVMGLVADDQPITAAGVADAFWMLYQDRAAEVQYRG
ncbi:SDR family NAD(P)-dependent oxidoreductase [Deinococcus sp. KNUC1210]|uniref:SDR family oxidoreductase n=1 Tax=Deinococcus sp. KNUC1210 TaxID=2917691 RepID=UPI001EEFA980|nr:SDR family NAD(P)-dependent oxidoreductase [Deinococcus sp. KNUC1210]ULH14864.1 SDR family NAD(P)-dependent oxidoreductase [Deinococcus sp. KNUC1210]